MRTLPHTEGSSATVTTSPPAPKPASAFQTDPALAAALFAAWSGDPAVVVASPPGAGKTRLVVHLAEQLHRRAGLKIAIATQTRSQALDVTNRATAIGASVALLGTRDSRRAPGLEPRAGYLEGAAQLGRWRGIVVATTARWLWVHERDFTADVLVVDEAWQMDFADLGGLGPLSAQVVLVGDPGQIAPVVTGDSRRWQDWSAGPQRAAPQALLAAYPDAVTQLRLTHTWRLGPETTALIQPAFYADLPFDSARPPRHLVLDGTTLPELSVQLVTPMAGHGDPILAATAATRVRELLRSCLATEEHGTRRRLDPHDVAVITPHVQQASAVAARLADLPGVLIATGQTRRRVWSAKRSSSFIRWPATAKHLPLPPTLADFALLCPVIVRTPPSSSTPTLTRSCVTPRRKLRMMVRWPSSARSWLRSRPAPDGSTPTPSRRCSLRSINIRGLGRTRN